MHYSMFFVGVDLGQRRDHSAIALVERPVLRETRFDVRGLERVPLGTPYPKVVERIWEIANGPQVRGRCAVTVDGTGVGGPVMDMMRGARMGCEICEVTITGGERAHQARSGGGPQRWTVPKRDLISGVQVMLEKGQLRIAKRMRQSGALVKELLDVRATAKENGRVRIGAEACGEHDDLVIAVALACWRAGRPTNGYGGGRLTGM
jgi:hypothetical protein